MMLYDMLYYTIISYLLIIYDLRFKLKEPLKGL